MTWQIQPAGDAFPQFAQDWDRLNDELHGGHPLFDSRFVGALLAHFGSGRESLCIHRTRDGIDGALILCPRGLGRWALFLPSQAQVGPLLVKDVRCLETLMPALPGHAWTIDLLAVDPKFEPDWTGLLLPRTVIHHHLTMAVSTREDFTSYWKARPNNLRKNLRRYRSRSSDRTATVRLSFRYDDVRPAIHRYAEIESSGWKAKAGTAIGTDNSQGRFYDQVMRDFAVSGQSRIIELWFEGKLAASRLVLKRNHMWIILKTTYDESLAALAPGRQLLYEALQVAFADIHGGTIEFYTNATRDQAEWATDLRYICHHQLYRSAAVAGLHDVIRTTRQRLLGNGRASTPSRHGHEDSSLSLKPHSQGTQAEPLLQSEAIPLPFGQEQQRGASSLRRQTPTAVVVGLCAHGLGLVRDLHRAGVTVHALENNRDLPGTKTKEAQIHWIDDSNGPGLISALIDIAHKQRFALKPVLLLTNDRMVTTVGEAIDQVAKHYQISWSNSVDAVLRFQTKDHIEERCREKGLNYPRSVTINSLGDLRNNEGMNMPLIAKPIRPLSEFKTLIAESQEELAAYSDMLGRNLPILVQEFIEGDDANIFFAALYLKEGDILARFEGRKLCSRPMGHTTIALSEPNEQTHELAKRFFDGLRMSGPVSLEVKRDTNGNYWVIEPTVGRTDFWAGLCSANGVNLALIEYETMAEVHQLPSAQTISRIWINEERHPSALGWLVRHYPRVVAKYPIQGVYWDLHDPAPFISAAAAYLFNIPARITNKVRRVFDQSSDHDPVSDVVVACCISELPDTGRTLLNSMTTISIEFASEWFGNMQNTVFANDSGIRYFCLTRHGRCLIVLPTRLTYQRGARTIESLANYYTSLYAPALAPEATSDDLALILKTAVAGQRKADVINLHPMDPDSASYRCVLDALRKIGWKAFPYFCFGNWYLRVTQSAADYISGREGALRNTIKRKGKRFHSANGTLEVVSELSQVEAATQMFCEVYAKSWKKPEPYPDFVPGLLRWLASTGKLRLGIARIDEQPVAAQIWIVNQHKASIYKLAYDEAHAAFAPGTLLTAHLMEHVIDRDGVTEVDYLIGDDPYKQSWMSHRRERWGIVAYNAASLAGIALALFETLGRTIRKAPAGIGRN